MTGVAEVDPLGFSLICTLSSSVVATLGGVGVKVIGVCSVCFRIEAPSLRAAAMAFFLGFLCCLIVCLCRLAMTEGAAVIAVKSLHSLWLSVPPADVVAGLFSASLFSWVVRIGITFSEPLWKRGFSLEGGQTLFLLLLFNPFGF